MKNQNGQGWVEYALTFVLIAIAIIVVATLFFGGQNYGAVSENQPVPETGCFRLPEGWEPVFAYGAGETGRVRLYCEWLETGIYARCEMTSTDCPQ